MSDTPNLVVLAGPNGAGKSTVAPSILPGVLGIGHFVNADQIANGLSAFRSADVGIAAGRLMLARLNELAAERAHFAFETTLASRTFAPWIAEQVAHGYAFHLIYLWLPSVEMAIDRVAGRVREGGHAIPEETIRRRYAAGLRNFFGLYRPLTTAWTFCDNSRVGAPRLLAEGRGARTERIADSAAWSSIEKEWADESRAVAARDGLSDRLTRAMTQAVQKCYWRHMRLLQPIVVFENGKIVHVPPEEIQLDPTIIDPETGKLR